MLAGAVYLSITSKKIPLYIQFKKIYLNKILKAFIRVGGYENLHSLFGYAIPHTTVFSNTTCGVPTGEYFNLVQPLTSDYPWLGMSLGLLISSIWYWCSEYDVFFLLILFFCSYNTLE